MADVTSTGSATATDTIATPTAPAPAPAKKPLANLSWDLGVGVDFVPDSYQFTAINDPDYPLTYNQLGPYPQGDYFLGARYQLPIKMPAGAERLKWSVAAGLYTNLERFRSDAKYSTGAYTDANGEQLTDANGDPVQNTEAQKNTFTTWRKGIQLGTQLTWDVPHLWIFGTQPFGVAVTGRLGNTSLHNDVDEFYAGAFNTHEVGIDRAASLADTQLRVGAVLGFFDVGLSIDGGVNSNFNEDLGFEDKINGYKPTFSSGADEIPSAFVQKSGIHGFYVDVNLGGLLTSQTKKMAQKSQSDKAQREAADVTQKTKEEQDAAAAKAAYSKAAAEKLVKDAADADAAKKKAEEDAKPK